MSASPRPAQAPAVAGKDCVSVLVIGGLRSATCVIRIENVLRAIAGVESASVNLLTRMATVRHKHTVQPEAFSRAISELGYNATLASAGSGARETQSLTETLDLIASRKSRFVAGAILTLLIVLIDQGMAGDGRILWLFLLATPVQITVGWEYYRGFFQALRQRTFNLDSLVVMGSTAAYLQGVLAFLGTVSNDTELMD